MTDYIHEKCRAKIEHIRPWLQDKESSQQLPFLEIAIYLTRTRVNLYKRRLNLIFMVLATYGPLCALSVQLFKIQLYSR